MRLDWDGIGRSGHGVGKEDLVLRISFSRLVWYTVEYGMVRLKCTGTDEPMLVS